MISEKHRLMFNLESLRLATLYAIPPLQGGPHQDPTPVTFTLAKTGLPSTINTELCTKNRLVNVFSDAQDQHRPKDEKISRQSSIQKPSKTYMSQQKSESSHDQSDVTKVVSIDNSLNQYQNGTRRSQLSFNTITVPSKTGFSQFSTRCDVVYKKLLRDFRRSYIQDFNNHSKYMKNKRYREDDYFLDCIKEYVLTHLPQSQGFEWGQYAITSSLDLDQLVLTFGSFLYPKEMRKSGFGLNQIFNGHQGKRTAYVTKFHDALYNFSMEKVSDILENKYIAVLLEKFIAKIDDRSKVQEIMSVFERSYSKALEILQKRVTEVIKDSKEASVVPSEESSPQFELSNPVWIKDSSSQPRFSSPN